MAAPKVWVPNELLKSADLNGAFSTVAQGYMPGLYLGAGTVVTGVAAGSTTEVYPAAPTAGNDQGGYWNTGTNRAVVPVGLGGLYLVSYMVTTNGGTKGDFAASIYVAMAQQHWFARSGFTMQQWVTYLAILADGQTAGVTVFMQTTGGDVGCGGLRLARLASFGLFR